MTTLDTLKSISSLMAEKEAYAGLLKQTQNSLDSNLKSLLDAYKQGAITFPFVYRDILIRCDSVGSLIVETVTFLEDPKPVLNKPKEWQLWQATEGEFEGDYTVFNTQTLARSYFNGSVDCAKSDQEEDDTWNFKTLAQFEEFSRTNGLVLVSESDSLEDLQE